MQGAHQELIPELIPELFLWFLLGMTSMFQILYLDAK